MTKVKPLANRVLVEVQAVKQKTASGIIIPDTARQSAREGTVIAAGPGTIESPITVQPGDKVLLGPNVGTTINVEGKDYLLVFETELYAILQ
jgi:chaperonin GroES